MKKITHIFVLLTLVLFSCKTENKTNENNSQTIPTEISQTKWDNSYGGADKSYDLELLKMREKIAPTFKTLKFTDKTTGKTMEYSLFVPKNYDKTKKYPLVLFMADASTVGKGVIAPLMQGYGGIIWATDESQAKNPSFVLVPSYKGPETTAKGMKTVVNDSWETTEEVDITLRLLDAVVTEYRIDKNRLYTTGQSMGGMMSFYFNVKKPDLFAASLFVGSQWDIAVLEPLTKKNFFYVVSAGDEKASKGMQELGEMLTKKGVKFGEKEFSAKLSSTEKEKQISELINENLPINFVKFTAKTVTPSEETKGGAEHMYSFDYAYQLESVRDWLFKQTKK